jgi:predicted dehydrogenase
MKNVSRRKFIKTAAAASTVFPLFTIAGTKASGRVIGANERVRVAVAGLGTRGKTHLETYIAMPDVEIAYLVDPDTNSFESRSEIVTSAGGAKPRCEQDIRKVLDDANLDVVSIATPNHWHSLMTIWACQAGKDVYVEKPLSHNVAEGRKVVEAARKYNRIVQHGTQRRSEPRSINVIAALQSGKYGKLLISAGRCYKPRKSIGVKPPKQPPENLDFNLWLGPVREQPYHENLVHYNWHWFWDTGNGDLGNQGVHEVDVARWAIKDATFPKRVWSFGGRFVFNDQGQTPNVQLNVYEYDDVLLVFEVRNTGNKYDCSNQFITDEGRITDDGFFHPKKGGMPEPIGAVTDQPPPKDARHFENFIAAVRESRPDNLNCPAIEGHHSAGICHLANISYRLGSEFRFDQRAHALGDNKFVLETFENLQAHLQGDLKLPADGTPYRLGRVLEFDATRERFTKDDEANELLAESCRAPFLFPNEV